MPLGESPTCLHMADDVKERCTAGDLKSIVRWVLTQGIEHEVEGIDVVLLKQSWST